MLPYPDPSASGHNPACTDLQSIHASCVALEGFGVLITGPSGSGKSELALRLIDAGFDLVADDRVCLRGSTGSAPAILAGLIEVRGVGILRMPHIASAVIGLHVDLAEGSLRLPDPVRSPLVQGVFLVLDSAHPAAVARVRSAVRACRGEYEWHAGAGAAC